MKTVIAFSLCASVLVVSDKAKPQNSQERFSSKKSQKFFVSITMKDSEPGDTFRLAYYENVLDRHMPERVIEATKNKSGDYVFRVNQNSKVGYISLFKETTKGTGYPKYILDLYLVEPGDSVKIDIVRSAPFGNGKIINWTYYAPIMNYRDYVIGFSGRGAAKFKCRYEIDRTAFADTTGNRMKIEKIEDFVNSKIHCDAAYRISMEVLYRYKNKISDYAFNILKANFIAVFEIARLKRILPSVLSKRNDTSQLVNLLNEYDNKLNGKGFFFLPEYSKIMSPYYCQFLIERSAIDVSAYGIVETYLKYKKKYDGELRDKVLTLFAIKWASVVDSFDLLEAILPTISADYYYNELKVFDEANSQGKMAYNFHLPDSVGKITRLDDFRGKVVFIDFWYKACYNCVEYYKSTLSKVEEVFKADTSVAFVTVNVDNDRKTWIDALSSGKYTSNLATNLFSGGMGRNAAVIKNYRVWSYPRPLVIDKEGRIFCNNYNELRSGGVDKIVSIINAARITWE